MLIFISLVHIVNTDDVLCVYFCCFFSYIATSALIPKFNWIFLLSIVFCLFAYSVEPTME